MCARSRRARAILRLSMSCLRTARKSVVLEDKTPTYAGVHVLGHRRCIATAVRLEDGVGAAAHARKRTRWRRSSRHSESRSRRFEEVLNDICRRDREGDRGTADLLLMLHYGAENMSFDPIVVWREQLQAAWRTGRKDHRGGRFRDDGFGCIYDGYCSDMTRTVAGRPCVTDEMQTVRHGVERTAWQALLPARRCDRSTLTRQAVKIIEAAGYGDVSATASAMVGLRSTRSGGLSARRKAAAGKIVTAERVFICRASLACVLRIALYVIEDGCIGI